MCALGTGRARRVGGGMVIPGVSTVGRGGGTAVSDRAKVLILGAGRVGAAVFRFLMM